MIYLSLWAKNDSIQWRIQDFPGGGREPSRRGVNTPNFPENCMKSKEFGRPGGGGVRPSRPPLDPPMPSTSVETFEIHPSLSCGFLHNLAHPFQSRNTNENRHSCSTYWIEMKQNNKVNFDNFTLNSKIMEIMVVGPSPWVIDLGLQSWGILMMYQNTNKEALRLLW